MPIQEQLHQRLEGRCPVCDSPVTAGGDVVESEIISCSTCCSMLVVDAVSSGRLYLEEAPQIEEDWGQ